jgi:hypothetical protein
LRSSKICQPASFSNCPIVPPVNFLSFSKGSSYFFLFNFPIYIDCKILTEFSKSLSILTGWAHQPEPPHPVTLNRKVAHPTYQPRVASCPKSWPRARPSAPIRRPTPHESRSSLLPNRFGRVRSLATATTWPHTPLEPPRPTITRVHAYCHCAPLAATMAPSAFPARTRGKPTMAPSRLALPLRRPPAWTTWRRLACSASTPLAPATASTARARAAASLTGHFAPEARTIKRSSSCHLSKPSLPSLFPGKLCHRGALFSHRCSSPSPAPPDLPPPYIASLGATLVAGDAHRTRRSTRGAPERCRIAVALPRISTLRCVRDNLLEVFRACNLQPTKSISYR